MGIIGCGAGRRPQTKRIVYFEPFTSINIGSCVNTCLSLYVYIELIQKLKLSKYKAKHEYPLPRPNVCHTF